MNKWSWIFIENEKMALCNDESHSRVYEITDFLAKTAEFERRYDNHPGCLKAALFLSVPDNYTDLYLLFVKLLKFKPVKCYVKVLIAF